MSDLKTAFEVFRGRKGNFMTPRVIGYYEAGLLAIELAEGSGIFGEYILGVSVRRRDIDWTDEKTAGLSRMCSSREEAEEYIKELRQKGKFWWEFVNISEKG